MVFTTQALPVFMQNKWIQALIIFLGFIMAAKIIQFIFKKIAEKTPTKADDIILERTGSAFFSLLAVIGFRVAFSILNLRGEITFNIVDSITILISTFIAIAIFDVLIEEVGKKIVLKTRSTLDEQILPLVHGVSKVMLFVIGVILVLNVWNVNITPLLAGLGIIGLVIGMALKPSLENILGGVSMVFDKNFKVGDVIQLESGDIGTVHDIGVRSTKILTPDGEYLIVPNGILANLKMKNLALPNPTVRVTIDFGVEYGTDVNDVKKIVNNILAGADKVLKEPAPQILLTELGESALQFRAMFWIQKLDDRLAMKDLVTTRIYESLNKEKIVIPYPTRTIYMKQ